MPCSATCVLGSRGLGDVYKRQVQRNRARRIMRAALSEHLSQNIGGYDIILVARARTPYLKSTQLSKTLAGLMRKAGLPDKAAAVPQQPAAKPQPNGAPE